jgi:hypothetical protein
LGGGSFNPNVLATNLGNNGNLRSTPGNGFVVVEFIFIQGSAMVALQIKNIPWGPGDDFKIDASYAVGDTKNAIATSGGSPVFAMFGGTNFPGAYQSIGFGATNDAIYLPVIFGGTGDLKLTTFYGVRGATGSAKGRGSTYFMASLPFWVISAT